MNNLEIFKNEEFGQIRTLQRDSDPYFCMVDICKALGITNVSKAKQRLNEDGVTTSEVIDSLGRKQNANFVNESNMYKLIFQSRKESAERFTDWVTSEVLPVIRQTGQYQKPMTIPEILELQLQAIKEVDNKADAVNKDLQAFKQDIPILGIEESKITNAVRRKGVDCLNGKDSNAYKDKSIRGKVFADIYGQLKREFGVTTYKAIKRNQCDVAIMVINRYTTPLTLSEQIDDCNAQVVM